MDKKRRHRGRLDLDGGGCLGDLQPGGRGGRPDPEEVAFDFGDSGDAVLDFGEESEREVEEVEEAGHW